MRTREELMQISDVSLNAKQYELMAQMNSGLMLEILLDIRDLLTPIKD